MRKDENKKLFFLPKALAALILCGSLTSCLQAVYDTGLLDYVPPTTPRDIKSPVFNADQGSTILIVTLTGGAFKSGPSIPEPGQFELIGTTVSITGLTRNSDTQVTLTTAPGGLPSGGYRLTVKAGALRAPANMVGVRALKSGWLVVNPDTVNSLFGTAEIWSMGYGNGQFLVTGARGKMARYSGDTGIWTAVLAGTGPGQSGFNDTDVIRAAAYGNGKFVAAGYGARMAFSANGTDWTGWREAAFDGDSILALTYGNGKFVAAGDRGKIRYSNSGDGGTWMNAQGTPFGETSILGLAYGQISGAPLFVAVGGEGKIAWSSDGVNWTAVEAGSNGGLGSLPVNAVSYGNGRFVAVADSAKIAWSDNGKTWTPATMTNSGFADKGVLSVTYGSGNFIAVGHNGHMAESPDGKNWTAITLSLFTTDEQIRAIAYGGGMFIAGGNAYSDKGGAAKMIYGY